MLYRRLLATLALMLAATSAAHAEPVTIALFGAAFAATTAGAIVTTIITIGLSLAVGLLQRALFAPKMEEPGVKLDIEIGDDFPVGFVAGTYATAGTRRYAGSVGDGGRTPNEYLIDVIQVGDLPAPGTPGVWVNGEKCTVLWDQPFIRAGEIAGYPVVEFREGSKDHLWVKYRDGTQTTADPYLRAMFGSEPDRPFKSTMVGRGCPYFVVTARVNAEMFPGAMRWLFEPPSIKLYDVRKDSTAGGAGAHRWNTPSTWEPSNNNAVIIYNVIRGLYYGLEWVYGGQNLSAYRLPAANWMAGANECDVLIDLNGGGQEKQFRSGYDVRGDIEPLAVIEDLAKAANARVAEAGGIFKILVGAPGAAVYSFTDGDIVVTKGQSYKPFPSLTATNNAVEATYPEPKEQWGTKDAPSLYDATLEAEDGNRRLPVTVNFSAAPFAMQVQRLMKAMRDDARRFRIHSFFLPPEAWLLEPNDVVSWSSARNGYVNKKFLIVRIDGEPGMLQQVLLKEIDPADYDWDPEADEQETGVGYLGPIRVPPQEMTGWQVYPATFKDANGVDQHPSVGVRFAGDMEDVRAARVQVRRAAAGDIVFDGELPYGAPFSATKDVVLVGTFLRLTPYQARGIFVPNSDRPAEWSAWLDVTTPDVRFKDVEVVLSSLGDDARAFLMALNQATIDAENRIRTLAANVAEGMGVQASDMAALLRYQGVTAGALRSQQVRIDAQDGKISAFAEILDLVNVAIGGTSASSLLRLTAEAGSGDVVARGVFQARATIDAAWVNAGIIIEAGFTGGDPTKPFARILNSATQHYWTGANGENPTIWGALIDGVWHLRELMVDRARIPLGELEAWVRPVSGQYYTANNPPSDSVYFSTAHAAWSINNESGNPVTWFLDGFLYVARSGTVSGTTNLVSSFVSIRNVTTGWVSTPSIYETTGSINARYNLTLFEDEPKPAIGNNDYELVQATYERGTHTGMLFQFNEATVAGRWGRR